MFHCPFPSSYKRDPIVFAEATSENIEETAIRRKNSHMFIQYENAFTNCVKNILEIIFLN